MRKSRNLRRLWYFKRRNLKYYRRALCITTILLIFTILWIYVIICLFPVGLVNYEIEIYERVKIAVKNEIGNISSPDGSYGDILDIKKDSAGRIISAKADNVKLSNLCMRLDKRLENILLMDQGKEYDKISASVLLPLNMQIHLGGAKIKDVQTKYVTGFSLEGTNKTRLKVLINVNITYEYLLGIRTRAYEFTLLDVLVENM